MPTKIKRKRRRKGRYITGKHRSPKCKTVIEYRSGWELAVCHYLDADPKVLEYGYECLIIPYLANVRTGKMRSYYPDFLVTYTDKSQILIEVKRKDKLADPKVVKKAKAAEAWCASQNPPVQYQMWTNNTIEAIKKINESKKPTPPKPKRRGLTKRK